VQQSETNQSEHITRISISIAFVEYAAEKADEEYPNPKTSPSFSASK